VAIEADAGVRKLVEERARFPLVAVAAEAIRTQCVDQEEQHVHIVAVAQFMNPVDCAHLPGICGSLCGIELEIRTQQEGGHDGCSGRQPGPTLVEDAF